MAEAPQTTSIDRQRRQRQNFLVVGGVLAILATALAYAAWDAAVDAPETVSVAAKTPATSKLHTEQPPQVEPTSDLIDDDGHSMWVSPTNGRPIDLNYLPPGVEIILALRPAELLGHAEGQKVFAALGPRADAALRSIEKSS